MDIADTATQTNIQLKRLESSPISPPFGNAVERIVPMLKTDYVQYFRSHKVNDLQNGSPSYKATSQFTYSLLFLYKIPHAKKIGHNGLDLVGSPKQLRPSKTCFIAKAASDDQY